MEEKRYTLRMSQEIFDKVKEQAKNSKRSVAKQIEYILEQHFSRIEKDQSN